MKRDILQISIAAIVIRNVDKSGVQIADLILQELERLKVLKGVKP